MTPAIQQQTSDEKLRGTIATKVLTYSTVILGIIASIIIIGGIVILFISYNNKGTDLEKQNAQNLITNIFYSLLPVISTWVGTVIAFYFGKENFKVASDSLNQLVNKITPDQFKSISVKQVLIDSETMTKFQSKDPLNLKLEDLIPCFSSSNDKSRLPIVDNENKPFFILHKDEYLKLISDKENNSKLILDFKQYGYNEPKGFVLIPETATLNEAQQEIKKLKLFRMFL